MKSKVNLVTILLTLSCVLRMMEALNNQHANHKEYPVAKKVIKEVHNKVAPNSAALLRGEDKTKVVKTLTRNTGLGLSKDYLHAPGNIESPYSSNRFLLIFLYITTT